MKKDRNTFFGEAQMSSMSYYPQPGMNFQSPMMAPNMGMQQGAPMQASQASQSYYAGPGMNGMPNTMNGMPNMNQQPSYQGPYMAEPTDYESRISKLERQVHRLESRVSKLEGSFDPMTLDNADINVSSNMYMI